MAEEKKTPAKKTTTHVASTTNSKEELLAVTKKNAKPYRITAIILWILGLVCEVFAILFFCVKVDWGFLYDEPGYTIAWISALALDLILVVIGSLLWKKANHTDPAPASNKFRFWLQNNLGVIVASVAFIPFIIFALTDKNASKKNKTIAAILAGVALLIGVLFGIDFTPVSQQEMLAEYGVAGTVYWTESGSVYHAYLDCGHIANSDVFDGSIAAAEENGKTRICKSCDNKLAKEGKTLEEKIAENDGASEQPDIIVEGETTDEADKGETTTAAAAD